MKPILILQNTAFDGPAYLATWLAREGLAFEVRCSEAGEAFPTSMQGFGGLAILGGVMSANDELASLRIAERLILEAMAADLPVIGHCLGGQLMAKALGAQVRRAAVPEIGWSHLAIADEPASRAWFGDIEHATVMQWHYDCFELPAGAVALASSRACAHQAFAIGRCLAMQFHIEIEAPKLQAWIQELAADDIDAMTQHPESAQSVAAMLADAAHHLPAHQGLADRMYRRWLFGA